MKIQMLGFLLPLVICAAAPSQTGVTGTLEAGGGMVKMGNIELTLTVNCTEDAEISAALLNGLSLDVRVGGQNRGELREAGSGASARIAAGTQIVRKLTVDLQRAGVQLGTTELVDVSFTWPGLQGASAMVKVAPDVSQIDVDDLDMSKTTVVLSTNYGNMTLAFYPEKAPNHVRNFLKLAQSGFYDGTKFHRVLSGFMIQGGCPNTREGATGTPGTGGPGWAVNAEFNDVKHVRGILSMARSQDPNSAGSQFFIVHGVASHLDGQYTAFGVLADGFPALDDIAAVPVGGPQGSEPLAPVHLYFAAILPVLNAR